MKKALFVAGLALLLVACTVKKTTEVGHILLLYILNYKRRI